MCMGIQSEIEEGRNKRYMDISGISAEDYDHFSITSGEQASREDAVKAFWSDYRSKGVPEGGNIIWRRPPVYMIDDRYDNLLVVHTIKCRFSIRV